MSVNISSISLYYVNAHSLNNKLIDLQCNLFSTLNPPDIIVITETWLQPDTFDQELGLTDYNIYRCDRDLLLLGLERGGGTLIAVKKLFKSILLEINPSAEQVFVNIKLNDDNIIIAASYFAPNSDHAVYKSHFDRLSYHITSLNCNKIIALGDYNLPKVSWFSDPLHFLPLEYINPSHREILQELTHFYSELDLIQHLSPIPAKGYTLDLLFSQQDLITIIDSPFDLLNTDAHHVSTFASINITSSIEHTVSSFKELKKKLTMLLLMIICRKLIGIVSYQAII